MYTHNLCTYTICVYLIHKCMVISLVYTIYAPGVIEKILNSVRLTAAQILLANQRRPLTAILERRICKPAPDWLSSAECGLMSGGCVRALQTGQTSVYKSLSRERGSTGCSLPNCQTVVHPVQYTSVLLCTPPQQLGRTHTHTSMETGLSSVNNSCCSIIIISM